MVHANAALPRFQLDAKRIIASSGVIALHVAVLMMLMTPMQAPHSVTAEDTPPIWFQPINITPPPPPPPPPIDRRVPTTSQAPVSTPMPEQLVEPVDQTVGALDSQAIDDNGRSNSFEANAVESPFVQLATLVAPAPPYPRAAEQRRLQGTVTLRIHVDAGGTPIEVMVERSSGHAVLDQAAIKVVKSRWRFVPATSAGVPIEAWALLPIEFVLQ
jgi:protein TonB